MGASLKICFHVWGYGLLVCLEGPCRFFDFVFVYFEVLKFENAILGNWNFPNWKYPN